MINGIANVINVSNQNAWAGEWWFQAIRTMGWALFAFLPIYVGMNAAKEFKGSAVLGQKPPIQPGTAPMLRGL